MTDDKTLKLDWKRAVDGSMFASTGPVDGWLIAVNEHAICIVRSESPDRMISMMRTKKDKYESLLEAEEFARMHVLKRFGALIT